MYLYWVCIDLGSWSDYLGGCCENLALNPSRDEASTTSVGDLFQSLTNLAIKIFFLITILILLFFSLELFTFALFLHRHIQRPPSSFLLVPFWY